MQLQVQVYVLVLALVQVQVQVQVLVLVLVLVQLERPVLALVQVPMCLPSRAEVSRWAPVECESGLQALRARWAPCCPLPVAVRRAAGHVS